MSDDAIQFSIERDLGDFNVIDPDDGNVAGATGNKTGQSELVKAAVISTRAAVEVSGLAPTIISCVTSGFAVVNEMEPPLWYAIGYVVAFIALGLFVIRMLAGHSFLEIGAREYTICLPWKGVQIKRTRTELVSWAIYGANSLLIAVALLVFVISPLSRHPGSIVPCETTTPADHSASASGNVKAEK
ncbi:hypothetical protein [Paraburkholderia sp. MM5477-R1]|uniref:hypothetical protein n=1 Tax=Paraburkholderia sp. MM5477-R1 TaxID=2991062 RepID=UPI003D1DA4E0